MKYRTLGRTGLEISEIGFGCGTSAGLMIGGPPETRRAAIGRALERGITLFDTAPVYGETLSETHLGQALRELGAKPVIATKVALETPDYDDLAGGVVRSIEGSLERLGVDVLPIVHMHNRVGLERMGKSPYGSGALLTLDDVLGKNGVVEGFERAKQRGLVRFIGCTAFGGDIASIEALIDSGKFDSIILNYSVLNQSAWLDGPTLNPLFTYGRVGARAASRGMGTCGAAHSRSRCARNRVRSSSALRESRFTQLRDLHRAGKDVALSRRRTAIRRWSPPPSGSVFPIRPFRRCWSGSPMSHTSTRPPMRKNAARLPRSSLPVSNHCARKASPNTKRQLPGLSAAGLINSCGSTGLARTLYFTATAIIGRRSLASTYGVLSARGASVMSFGSIFANAA